MRETAFENLYGSNPATTVSLFTEGGSQDRSSIKLNIFPPAPNQDQFRTIVLDPGDPEPAITEQFSGLDIVALRGGGFAVAYTQNRTTIHGDVFNSAVVTVFDAQGTQLQNSSLSRAGTIGDDLHPTLVALANGGVAVVTAVSPNPKELSSEGGFTTRFFDARGVQTGTAAFSSVPTLVDTGAGVVATWRSFADGGVVREVVGTDGALLRPLEVVTRLDANSLDGRVLTGGPGPDDIRGGAGADTLIGGAGVDVLDGDRGLDLLVFRLDGSVDVAQGFGALDFNLGRPPSGGDLLRIETSDGRNAAADPASILAYDNQSGVLSIDVDGGAGPAGFVPVAVLGAGRGAIFANELAAGFEPGLIRRTNTDGTHSDVRLGYGREDFTQASADFDRADRLAAYVVDYRDGHRTLSRFDADNSQFWTRTGADFDTQGRLAFYGVLNDDGSHTNSTFDPANTQPYQRVGEEYDAQGRLAIRGVRMDDNSLRVDRFDVDNTKPYGFSVEFYDPAGNLTSVRFFNDDGSPFL